MSGKAKYPFRRMSIGDAFDIPYTPERLASMRTYVYKFRDADRSFAVRHIRDEGVIEVSCVAPNDDPPVDMIKPARALPKPRTMQDRQREVDELMSSRSRRL